jgi:hypothetical protein
MFTTLQKMVAQLPAPYEVDPHEWGITLATILNCRNSLISFISKIDLWHTSFSSTYQQQLPVLATFNLTLDPVEALLLQVSAELHNLLPLKVDEAIAYMSHTFETVVGSSVWREDWEATSVYKKGKKVSPGVLSLGLMYRSLLHTIIQTLQPHTNLIRRLCASVLTIAIRLVFCPPV